MNASLAKVVKAEELAEHLVLHLAAVGCDGAAQILHCGVGVGGIVAVGVHHQQWARGSVKSCHVVLTHAEDVDHLHVLCAHRYVLHLLQPSQRHHVFLIDAVVDFVGVGVHLLFIEKSTGDGALRSARAFLADDQLYATALCSHL